MRVDPGREPVVGPVDPAQRHAGSRGRGVRERQTRAAVALVVERGEEVDRHYARGWRTITCGSSARRGCTKPTTRAPGAAASARSMSVTGTTRV